MKTVNIKDGKIYLCSALLQDAFARTNLALATEEKGKTAQFNGGKVIFSDFSLRNIEKDDENFVCFTSDKVLKDEAETFEELLSQKKTAALQKLVLALTEAYKNGIDLKAVSAEGIIYSDEKIIFLPSELFWQCVSNNRPHNDLNQNDFKYIYKGLDEKSQLLFLRSIISYRALTGNLPFNENDLSKRQTDISDENFIPLELCVSSIDKTLAESINAGLKLKGESVRTSKRKEFSDTKEEKKRAEQLELALKFSPDDFSSALSALNAKDSQADTALEDLRNAFVKKQKIKIQAKRFIRRNRNALFAALAVLAFASWMANGFLRENALLATTKSLTSTQSAALLYTFIHKADVPDLQEVAKGNNVKDLLFKVAAFYVTGKQREEQNAQDRSVTPGQWLFYKESSTNWMYGITNLKIDGNSFPSVSEYPKRKDKTVPLKEEGGKALKRGDTVTHRAEYYLVHQDSNRIYAEKNEETVELKWNGSRWIIRNITDGKSEQFSVNSKDFSDEYYEAVKETGSIKSAVARLRNKYGWLPSDSDIRTDAAVMLEDYQSIEAGKYLEDKLENDTF